MASKILLRRAFAPLLIFVAAACAGSPSAALTPIDLLLPWTVATPTSQHVDEPLLAAAYARGQSTVGLRSLLVVRNGFLVGEQYFGDAAAESLSDLRSVTKSVMSLLVGIAIARDVIPGTGEKLDALIHPPVALIDGPKAGITVDNLLTMTSGFSWDESTPAGYNEWALATDQIEFLLARPLSDLPGTRFNYNSAAVHLLSVGLSQATAGSAQAFADENLFAPLGIRNRTWESIIAVTTTGPRD